MTDRSLVSDGRTLDDEMTPRTSYTVLAWATLLFTLLVVIWGGYVSASGAGDGCGDSWPLCGELLEPSTPTTSVGDRKIQIIPPREPFIKPTYLRENLGFDHHQKPNKKPSRENLIEVVSDIL